eukprot:GEMP01113464.1.p1 GENE.GEMP01113464.1~~GEMP01113464.1.p1  ORF type:complete len:160 (+),score=35.14 GEMP01113464.1:157-636(+)
MFRTLARRATKKLTIPEHVLTKRFCRSTGPGGQNANSRDTQVQVSFNLQNASWIPTEARERIAEWHKNKISKQGLLMISSQETTSQLANYQICLDKIREMVKSAEEYKEVDMAQFATAEYVIAKKKAEGKEKDLEERERYLKERKNRSRERTKSKRMPF